MTGLTGRSRCWRTNDIGTPDGAHNRTDLHLKLALFDLDHTLLPLDSDYAWGQFTVRLGWRDAETELSRHRARVEAAAREAEYLRASAAELAKLDPQPGEETELADLRAGMMRSEKVATEIADARDVLSGSDSPLPQLANLMRRLERKSAEAPGMLEEVVKLLDEALISLDAAQSGIEAALRATEFDPKALERAEERLFGLRAASRKYSVPVDDLAELRSGNGSIDAAIHSFLSQTSINQLIIA